MPNSRMFGVGFVGTIIHWARNYLQRTLTRNAFCVVPQIGHSKMQTTVFYDVSRYGLEENSSIVCARE